MPLGGSNPLPQTLTVVSTGPGICFLNPADPVTTDGGAWLGWSGCSGDCGMPSIFSVTINAAGLKAGVYTGQIVFTAYDRSQSRTVPVTLTIVAVGTSFFNEVPGALSFVYGPSYTASSQTIQIINGGGGTLSWSAKATMFDGPANITWLSFAASGGIAPAILTINVSPQGLSPGLYLGQILLQAASGNITISVSLEVAGASNAVFQQPAPLNFTVPVGLAPPHRL